VLFNSIDYYADKNKHQLLNPEKIATIAKYAEIEPKIVSKNLYVQTAYNLEHHIMPLIHLIDNRISLAYRISTE